MMNLSNSDPSLLDWNVEFIDDSVVLKKGTSQFIGHDSKNPNEPIYMLNDQHKTPFKMYFLGTFDIYKSIGLELKYNEYIYNTDDDNYDYKTKMFSINDNCKINVLMKKLNNQIPQIFTNEELNKINLSELNEYPIYYNYIINLINKQKHKIDESEQLMNELKNYVLMNQNRDKTLLKFDLHAKKEYDKLLPNHKIKLDNYINESRKIKTIIIKKNEDINDFLQNPPTRDLQNNIKLFEYFFNRKPSDYEIQLLNVHEPQFNIRKQIKKYQFKTYSRVPGGFIGDIFFNKSKFACLLLININTRKAYSYALNNVEVYKVNPDSKGSQIKPKARVPKEAKPIGGQNEEYTITYSTTNKKTTSNLINVFKQFLNDIDHKITSLRFDNESAVKSKQFQTMLRNNGIKFIPVVEGSHTSLSLIDRLCRTIRDISYNMGIKILTQNDINKVLNVYNNMYHSSLSKILGKKITPNEVNEHPELEQQIINYCIDYNKQLKVLHPEIELQVGQICKVYQPFDKFKKRRRLLKKDYYKIVNKTGNIYTVQNVRNNKKIDVPRYFIYDV